MSNDHDLQEGQILLEAWHVEFKGMGRRRRPIEEWVECRIVKMNHGTVYGGAHGVGKTVDEARLEAVLGLARAITDDPLAFDHDADQLFMEETHRWWLAKIQEHHDELEALTVEFDNLSKGAPERKKLKRRIKRLENLMAEWQEDHDYYPQEAPEGEAASREARSKIHALRVRSDSDKRRAAGVRLGEAAQRANSVGGTVAS